MAFATRTLIDTGKADGGAGKEVILLDLSAHNVQIHLLLDLQDRDIMMALQLVIMQQIQLQHQQILNVFL